MRVIGAGQGGGCCIQGSQGRPPWEVTFGRETCVLEGERLVHTWEKVSLEEGTCQTLRQEHA